MRAFFVFEDLRMEMKGRWRDAGGVITARERQQTLPGLDRGEGDVSGPRQRPRARKATTARYDKLPDVLTPKEAQVFLRLGRNATYELLKNGAIRNIRLGQKFLIPKEALRDFLDVNGEPGGTGTPVKGHA